MSFRHVSFGPEFIELPWARAWRSSELCPVTMSPAEIGPEWFFLLFAFILFEDNCYLIIQTALFMDCLINIRKRTIAL